MGKEIFRKKSLEKVQSPENLNDYIRVSNPGVWLLLVSIIILLAGVCVWGIFGHVDSTVPSVVYVEQGKAVCYVEEKDITSVHTGMTVKFANCEAKISKIGDISDRGYTCFLTMDSTVDDGYYDSNVIVKSYRPLSFILN